MLTNKKRIFRLKGKGIFPTFIETYCIPSISIPHRLKQTASPPLVVPTLFFDPNQSDTPVPLPLGDLPIPIMSVNAETTEMNQRIKLDATLSTRMTTPFEANISFGGTVTYTLFRDGAPLTSIDVNGMYHRTSSASFGLNQYFFYPNINFVDIPGPAGNYHYEIQANHHLSTVGTTFHLTNRGFTATVYPAGP